MGWEWQEKGRTGKLEVRTLGAVSGVLASSRKLKYLLSIFVKR